MRVHGNQLSPERAQSVRLPPRFNPLPQKAEIAVYTAYPDPVFLTRVRFAVAQSWVTFSKAKWRQYGISVELLIHPAPKVIENV